MNNISTNNAEIQWSDDVLKTKLETIGNLEGKKVAWIKSDLSLTKSSVITRFFWTFVAKHFAWMRSYFYGINLDQSSALLEQVGQRIQSQPDPELQLTYFKAISKFSEIAPNHSSNFDEYLANPPFEGLSKTEALGFVRIHGDKLKSLDFNTFENLDESNIKKFIEHCPNLQRLKMNPAQGLHSHEILEQLPSLTQLESLDMSNCNSIRFFNPLGEVTSLKELKLTGTGLDDLDLYRLGTLTNLQHLWIENCMLINEWHIHDLVKDINNNLPEGEQTELIVHM